jgi:hypothetical protein
MAADRMSLGSGDGDGRRNGRAGSGCLGRHRARNAVCAAPCVAHVLGKARAALNT